VLGDAPAGRRPSRRRRSAVDVAPDLLALRALISGPIMLADRSGRRTARPQACCARRRPLRRSGRGTTRRDVIAQPCRCEVAA
jgi:hypothetical protein